jgi:hypothetical protein
LRVGGLERERWVLYHDVAFRIPVRMDSAIVRCEQDSFTYLGHYDRLDFHLLPESQPSPIYTHYKIPTRSSPPNSPTLSNGYIKAETDGELLR